MSATTMFVDSAKQPAGTLGARLAVPWFTVLWLAAVMAYADGFWMVSLRGATGAIERSDGAFTAWWRESTVSLPVFVIAVLGALTLLLRMFGPVLRSGRAVALGAVLVAVAGTIVGIAEIAISSAYDYYLQANQLQMIESMHGACVGSCLAQAQQSSLDLQVRAVLYASGLLLASACRSGRMRASPRSSPSPAALPAHWNWRRCLRPAGCSAPLPHSSGHPPHRSMCVAWCWPRWSP